jgi:hypothetical protein
MDSCDYCDGPMPPGRWETVELGDGETVKVPVRGWEVRLPVKGDFPVKRFVCSEACAWEWDRKHWLEV